MSHTLRSTAELGRLVRSERKSLGLTQTDLAGASGLSVRFVSELERGRPTAGIGRVFRVLEMLGLEVVVTGPQPGDD